MKKDSFTENFSQVNQFDPKDYLPPDLGYNTNSYGGNYDMNNGIAEALIISDSIDKSRRSQENLQTDRFLNENSWCYIKSKEIKKKFLSKEYYLTCVGLNTGETKEIFVGEELYNEAIDKLLLIKFKQHKNSDLDLFIIKNKKSGYVVLNKYADDKSNTYVMRLYGNDSDTICVVDCTDKEAFDSYNEGSTYFDDEKQEEIKEESLETSENSGYIKFLNEYRNLTLDIIDELEGTKSKKIENIINKYLDKIIEIDENIEKEMNIVKTNPSLKEDED